MSVTHTRPAKATTLLATVASQRTVNFDTKQNGDLLTAAQYNLMNNTLITLCNNADTGIQGLKSYVTTYLPNFIDVTLDTSTSVQGTLTNGVMTIDLTAIVTELRGNIQAVPITATEITTIVNSAFS